MKKIRSQNDSHSTSKHPHRRHLPPTLRFAAALGALATIVATRPRVASAECHVQPNCSTESQSCLLVCDPDAPTWSTGGSKDDETLKATFTRSPGQSLGSQAVTNSLPRLPRRSYPPAATQGVDKRADAGVRASSTLASRDLSGTSRQAHVPIQTVVQPPSGGIQPPFPFPRDQAGARSLGTDGSSQADPHRGLKTTDPVDPVLGEMVVQHTDLSFPGFGVPFSHERTYRSRVDFNGPFGPGWDFSYNQRLTEDQAAETGTPCGPTVLLTTGAGTTLRFRESSRGGGVVAYSTDASDLVLAGAEGASGLTWTLRSRGGEVRTFDAEGRLSRWTDANGIGLSFVWGPAVTQDSRLDEVVDSVGRHILYHYDGRDRLVRVDEASSGLFSRYSYDRNGGLEEALRADGRSERYEYDVRHDRVAGTWLPERRLESACKAACAVSNGACEEPGHCAEITTAAFDECKRATTACTTSCKPTCAPSCNSGCSSACGNQAEAECDASDEATLRAKACTDLYTSTGAKSICSSCDDTCQRNSGESCRLLVSCLIASTDGEGKTHGEVCVHGDSLNDVGDAIEDIGRLVELAAATFAQQLVCAFTLWQYCPDWQTSIIDDICDYGISKCCKTGARDECALDSCNLNESCKSACENTFFGRPLTDRCLAPDYMPGQRESIPKPGEPAYQRLLDEGHSASAWSTTHGCLPTARAQCINAKSGPCTASCAAECTAGCNTTCEKECHSADAETYCKSLDLGGICQRSCTDLCLSEAHALGPFVGPKYGSPTDLNFNLIRVYEGNGNLYLENTYGTDIASPDFDTVITQRYGAFHAEMSHVDLKASLPSQPWAAGKVEPLFLYRPPAICVDAFPASPQTYPHEQPDPGGIAVLARLTGLGTPLPSPGVDTVHDAVCDASDAMAADGRPSQCPNHATVLRDLHGSIWTYYADAAGRIVRTHNHDTGASWWVKYDAAGRVIGTLGPDGEQHCTHFDGEGNPDQALRIPGPVPGIVPPSPIRQYFSWSGWPKRMTAVSDPRLPSRMIEQRRYDAWGNLQAIVAADGLVTQTSLVGGSGPDRFMPGRITAPDGSVTRLTYDVTNGTARTLTTDATGAQPIVSETFADAAGRPTRTVSPLGLEETFGYDGPLLLTRTVRGDGRTYRESFTYDRNAQPRTVTDSRRQISTIYDAIGRTISTTKSAIDGSLLSTQCENRSPGGRLVDHVSAEGVRTHYEHDGEGRIREVHAGDLGPAAESWDDACLEHPTGGNAHGLVATYEYDAKGHLARATDGRGFSTTWTYDGFGRPIEELHADGGVVRTGYDALGNVAWQAHFSSTTDLPYRRPQWNDPGLLAAVELTYDARGRLDGEWRWHFDAQRQAVGSGYATTRYAYDDVQRVVTITDAVGHVTSSRYDGAGRTVEVTLPDGSKVQTSFADGGRTTRTTKTLVGGPVTEVSTRTATGAPYQSSIEVNGQPRVLQTIAYSDPFRPLSVTDANGLVTSLSFDAFGRAGGSVGALPDRAGEDVRVVYDRDDNVTTRRSQAAANGPVSTWQFHFDGLGRPDRVTDPSGAATTTEYLGPTSYAAATVDPRGARSTLTWAPTGWLSSVDVVLQTRQATVFRPALSSRTTLVFERDGLGRLSRASRVDNGTSTATSTFTFDSLGNTATENDDVLGAAATRAHAYNNISQRVFSTYGANSVQREFDLLGRQTSLVVGGDFVPTATWAYNRPGGPVSRTLRNYVTTTYGYDALSRLNSIGDARNAKVGSATLSSLQWQLPLDGVPRLLRDQRGAFPAASSAFAIDALGRVAAEQADLTASFQLGALDTTSAATTRALQVLGYGRTSYELDGRNNWMSRTTSGTTTSYVHDARDSYTQIGATSTRADARGALVLDDAANYSYDPLGSLASVQPVDTTVDGRRYQRDALGRVVTETNIRTGEITRYGWDGNQLAFIRRPNGDLETVIAAEGNDQPVVTLLPNGARHYHHQDRQGSVYMLTNTGGQAVLHLRYSAYGTPTIRDASNRVLPADAMTSPFGFHGLPHDMVRGLVDMRARVYRPAMGRFLSPDPIGLAGGNNLFAFVSSAPLAGRDPSGLAAENDLAAKYNERRSDYLQWARNYVATGSLGTGDDSWMFDEMRQQVPAAKQDFLAVSAAHMRSHPRVGRSARTIGEDILGPYETSVDNLAAMRVQHSLEASGGLYGSVTGAVFYGFAKNILGASDDNSLRAATIGAGVGDMFGATASTLQTRAYNRSISGGSGNGPSTSSRGGPVECPCFAGDTTVQTESGPRAISEVQEGELLWSENPETGERALKPVIRRYVTPQKALVEVDVEEVSGAAELIRATPGHPFWVEGMGWIPAQDLTPGEVLHAGDGRIVRVTGGHSVPSSETVYNFEVEGWHTYFVGAANVLVHNGCEDCSGEDGPAPGSRAVTNSGGRVVTRTLVSNEDALLQFAERFAGGSLDSFKNYKDNWWQSPDGMTRIEFNLEGHPKPMNEGPHVSVRVFDGQRHSVVEKAFIVGQETFKPPRR